MAESSNEAGLAFPAQRTVSGDLAYRRLSCYDASRPTVLALC